MRPKHFYDNSNGVFHAKPFCSKRTFFAMGYLAMKGVKQPRMDTVKTWDKVTCPTCKKLKKEQADESK